MKKLLLFLAFGAMPLLCRSQVRWSVLMTDSFMKNHPDSIVVKPKTTARWDYEQGLMLKAIEKVWRRTADDRYFNYIQHDIDHYVDKNGNIRTYNYDEYNLDNISTGRPLLMLSQQSLAGADRYRKAADQLWQQIENQPKTDEGGYWHKQRYPNQMWLDGLFMAEPFSAEYSKVYNHPEHFDDIARQFALIEKYAVDTETGLIYHGYDASKLQAWADKSTGLSPHFWGRAIGWYAMALVEVLDYFPENHPKRQDLISYLQRLAPALAKYQDPASGVWYQMTALGNKEGNYLEASASCMFTYALLKGVRKGYLPENYRAVGLRGFDGILKEFITKEADGSISLEKTVSVGGLGGNPYRDGSYEYYLSEPIRKNDLKGIGPFIFAAIEKELVDEGFPGKGQTVGLDYYFNHEFRKGFNGETEQFHYTWEDPLHSGFLWFGDVFKDYGTALSGIKTAPTKQSLKGLEMYIIVDPDDKKEAGNPHYIGQKDRNNILKWVKKGGTLLLMTNDSAHCELTGANLLLQDVGMGFTFQNLNMVEGTQWEMGSVLIPPGNEIFKNTQEVYIKELVTLQPGDARPILQKDGQIVMAVKNVGKGRIAVVGDPWLYNEYTDGRRIPKKYQNYQAAKDLARWMLEK